MEISESTLSFVIKTAPRPKKRPKVYRYATVNPSKEDEEVVANLYLKIANRPKIPLEGQIRTEFKFYVSPPKNTPKWKLQYIVRGYVRPNKSPDLDNYVKLILDALNGLLWLDDRFIIEIHSGKYYTLDNPRTEILINEIPQPVSKIEAAELFKDMTPHKKVSDFFEIE